MLEIDNKIVSLEVLENKFCCDIEKCLGACCVHGDYGAPLEKGEKEEIEKYFPVFKKYMPKEAIREIENSGFFVLDFENEPTTPLVNKRECAYVYFENKMAKCAIEKAFLNGEIPFRKPVSCHLYPIRTKKYKDFEAVNYHYWHICSDAIDLGEEKNISVVDFLKEALIRKYGKEWYDALKYACDNYNK